MVMAWGGVGWGSEEGTCWGEGPSARLHGWGCTPSVPKHIPPGPFVGMLSSAGAPISDWPGGQPGCSQLPVVVGAVPVTMEQQVPPEAAGHTQVDPLTKHTWGTRSTVKTLKDQSPVVVFFWVLPMDGLALHTQAPHPTGRGICTITSCTHMPASSGCSNTDQASHIYPHTTPPPRHSPPPPTVGNTQRHLLRYFLHPTPTHLPASLARTKQTELHKCIRTPPLSPPPPLRITQRHLLHCVLHHPHHAPTPHQPPQSLHPHPPTCRHPQG
jgi:hypothetical protein